MLSEAKHLLKDTEISARATPEEQGRDTGLCGSVQAAHGWRHAPETLWLAEAPVHPLQQALKDLDRAWTNCFAGRVKPPRFKKRGRGDSFRYPDGKQILETFRGWTFTVLAH